VNYRDYSRAYVIPVVGDTRLQDLTVVRLNLLYAHLLRNGRVKQKGGLAPKTVQNVHRMLHRALSDAVKWGYLPRNFAEDAHPPRVSHKRPTIWTPGQLGDFVRHVREDRFYALWLLVTTTGFRRGELAGLLRDDVDLVRARVSPSVTRVVVAGHVHESETKTTAGIPSLALDPDTRDALRSFIDTWELERHLLSQNTQFFVRVARWPTAAPRHDHAPLRQALRRRGAATHPTARRPTLLRQRRPEGGSPAEGDQRATRAFDCGLHTPDLRARHPGHG
jgi:integrase